MASVDQPCHVCSEMCERLMTEANVEEDRLRVDHQAELKSALASAELIVNGTRQYIIESKKRNEEQATCIEAQRLQIHKLYMEIIALKHRNRRRPS